MNKLCIVSLLVFVSGSAFSQIRFEKGYFITSEGERVECYIKNKGWSENPTEIEYRLNENTGSKIIKPEEVKEFGIDNTIKYVCSTVKIDRSPGQVDKLTTFANPIFEEEQLFLKVLVEGKANLYSYENGKIKRFFFNIDESQIEQLIFKLYKQSHNTVSENNRFRQQLWNSLICPSVERKSLENINYTKNALTKVFAVYNSCSGSELTQSDRKVERQLFAVSVRPRWNSSSMWAKNHMDRSFDFNWGGKNGFGLGIEGELFLGLKKNKWSLIVEPTYRDFSGNTTSIDHGNPGSIAVAQLDYKSIELPLGVRHYFFLSPQSKIFINASYILDFAISVSQLAITRPSGYPLGRLEIDGGNNFAIGAGFKYRSVGVEFRYHTTRDPLKRFLVWEAEYENVSIILGYSIINKKS